MRKKIQELVFNFEVM